MSNFRPLEVVDRGSETQLQVGEKLLNYLSRIRINANSKTFMNVPKTFMQVRLKNFKHVQKKCMQVHLKTFVQFFSAYLSLNFKFIAMN